MSDLRSPAPATGFELPGSGYHDPVPNRAAMFGWLAVCGGLVAAIAVVTLDVLLGGEPVRGRTRRLQTISEYVYSSGAWAFDIGVVALAAGSAALILGLVRRRLVTPISPGSIFLTLWVIGLAGIVAFPKHNWAIGQSGSGTVHRVASLIAFLTGPVAVLLIARRHRDSGVARAAFWLAIGGLAFLGVLVGGDRHGGGHRRIVVAADSARPGGARHHRLRRGGSGGPRRLGDTRRPTGPLQA